MQPLGIYVSIPFCKAKCTFCNFASDAFPAERVESYVDRLCLEIQGTGGHASSAGLLLPREADSLFFGGGTPSLLGPAQIGRVFAALRQNFRILPGAEITVEAAPGQISEDLLDALLLEGVNRISLGVQSFVDAEARAVGRLHTAAQCLDEIARLRNRGVRNLNIDLIAGMPHQTATSWQHSLETAIHAGVDHISVYMLEVDEDSRLGREVMALELIGRDAASSVRYGANAVPEEALVADLYGQAVEVLNTAGLLQYEISNFARPGFESRHNLKYWTRAPYIGFGLDAHSMLHGFDGRDGRFANGADLEPYLAGSESIEVEHIDSLAQFEEAVFLGLRLTDGLSIEQLQRQRPPALVKALLSRVQALECEGLISVTPTRVRLTPAGRIVSSSVFGELLAGLDDELATTDASVHPPVA